ncbi:MAG: hypothetical protein Q9186_002752 [Xanthomendoza sp. 1 TL-2023]
MNVSEGNQLLHIVQEQRLTGTIDDEDIPEFRGQRPKALAWLRKKYPVDEERAIHKRLEREERAALEPRPAQKSVFEQMRKRNQAKQAEKDAEDAKAEAEGTSESAISRTRAIAAREERLAVRTAWYEKYRKKSEESGLKSVPQMSFIRRVGPASLTAFAVVSLCVMFAQHYTPPPRAARLLPEVPMAMATVGALISINIAVWVAWRYPPLWLLMNRVCLIVPAYPYASSLLGSLFSHQSVWHLASNMAFLWFIGTKLHEDIGRGHFLALYLGSGVAASHILLVLTVLRKDWPLTSLGKGIRIWPLPPAATEAMQPLYFLAFSILVEYLRLRKKIRLDKLRAKLPLDKQTEGEIRIDHVTHLAGYFIGILASGFVQPEVRTKQRKSNERGQPEPVMERMEVSKPSNV